MGNLYNFFAKQTFVKFRYNVFTGVKSVTTLQVSPFRQNIKLIHFSSFTEMVFSPKTFLKNLFEIWINLNKSQMAYLEVCIVNNPCWLAT